MSMRRVAIFVDMEGSYGRDVLQGVCSYLRSPTPWTVYGHPARIAEPINDLSSWVGDWVIAQIWSREMRASIQSTKLPVVNVSNHLPDPRYPSVLSDSRLTGDMAARHLIERGYRNLAFVGYSGHRYSELRAEGFASAVRESGGRCDVLQAEAPLVHPERWALYQEELKQWLHALPKPVGILACNDVRARQIAHLCQMSGIRIPEEVALIGVDNDALVCEMSNPPLSSIDVAPEQIGYRAAALLEQMMDGDRPPARPILVPPRGVIARRSSESLAIPDPSVAEAMRYIHSHASREMSVEDVVGAVSLSRRVLERRFRAILNCTIYDAIEAARIDRVKAMLANDDAPTLLIAERCGFQHVQQFNRMFKRFTGLTPTAYRRQFRSRSLSVRW
jgi:LacI family transcriptional regulator